MGKASCRCGQSQGKSSQSFVKVIRDANWQDANDSLEERFFWGSHRPQLVSMSSPRPPHQPLPTPPDPPPPTHLRAEELQEAHRPH